MRSIADFLLNAKFCQLLDEVDRELREETRTKGCQRPQCGQPLDTANYPRKLDPRMVAEPGLFEWAFSLCCRICRRRARVPSVRFAGRCRTALPTFLLASLFLLRLTEHRISKLRASLQVTKPTLLRWRHWFSERFPETRTARKARAKIPTVFHGEALPWILKLLFAKPEKQADALRIFAELHTEKFTLTDGLSPPAENVS